MDVTNNGEPASDCRRHEWLIDSPNGPTSRGVCMNCGQMSEFKNSMPISGWDRSGGQARRAKQSRA